MYFPRTLFWMNNARSGAENICERDDPRQTCVISYAGDYMNNTRAKELGVMQYLFGGGAEAQTRREGSGEADDSALAQASSQNTQTLRHAQQAHQVIRPLGAEERVYIENAPVAGHLVTEEERAAAGQLGAEWTGPTAQEVTQAGGDYQAASDKAVQVQQGSGEQPTHPPGQQLAQAEQTEAQRREEAQRTEQQRTEEASRTTPARPPRPPSSGD